MPPAEKNPAPPSPPRVMDCRAGDHEYLHKDFHGALCYAVRYLDETCGADATDEWLFEASRRVYAPLRDRLLRGGGLAEIEKHFRQVFDREGGDALLENDGETLTITVRRCPAVAHIRENYPDLFTDRFCETTVRANAAICSGTAVRATCDYEPGAGRCVQRFILRRGGNE